MKLKSMVLLLPTIKISLFSKNLDRGLEKLTTNPLLENSQCKADLLPLEAENGQLWGAKTDLL